MTIKVFQWNNGTFFTPQTGSASAWIFFSFSFFPNRPKLFVPVFNTTVSTAPEPLWSSLLGSSILPRPRGLQFFPQSCLLKPETCPLGASSCLYPPPTLPLLKTDTLLGTKVGASQAAAGPFQISQQQEPIIVMRLPCSPSAGISSTGLQTPPPPPAFRMKDGDAQSPQRNNSRPFGDDRPMIAETKPGALPLLVIKVYCQRSYL